MAPTSKRDVVVRFVGDTGNLEKGLDGLKGRFVAVGAGLKGIAAAGGTVAAAGFLRNAITAASDLGETTSKVGTIFGDVAPQIEAFGDSAARTIGQSKQVAMDGAATFATYGKAAGLAGTELATFSTDLVTLASDMASFSNTTPEEAIEALGAALRGESDPIEQYGVLLNEAKIQNRAFEMGLIRSKKDALDPQLRVLAATAEIYAQTGDAQGDFARTAEGAANSQKILTAEFQNQAAELGQKFLPLWNEGIKTLTNGVMPAVGGVADAVGDVLVPALSTAFETGKDLVGMWQSLPGPVQSAAVAMAAWAVIGNRVTGVFGAGSGALKNFAGDAKIAAEAFDTNKLVGGFMALEERVPAVAAMGQSFRKARGEVTGFGSTLKGVAAGSLTGLRAAGAGLVGFLGGPWGLAFAGAAAVVTLLSQTNQRAVEWQQKLAESGKRVAEALAEQNGAIDENVRKAAAKELDDRGLIEAADDLGLSTGTVTAALLDEGFAYDNVTRIAREAMAVQDDASKADGRRAVAAAILLKGLTDLKGSTDSQTAALMRQSKEADASATAITGANAAAVGGIPSQQQYAAFIEATGGKFDEAADMGDQLADAIKRITGEAVNAVEAEEAYHEAIDALTQSIKDNGFSLDIHTVKGRANRDAVENAAQAIRDKTLADIESGVPMNQALKRHNDRITALRNEATKTFGAKSAANQLITTYGEIPKDVVTAVRAEGVEKVRAALADLSVRQYLLETGLPQTDSNMRRVVNERRFQYADGGQVRGPGGPTDDRIPAWLSNGEYVQTAAAVSYYGPDVMDKLNRRAIPKDALRFARGGMVWPFPVDVSDTKIPNPALYPGGASIPQIQAFARAQAGKRYQWGATGPNTWDCSGLVGAIWALAHGMNPYQRYMTTATMGAGKHGMKPGAGKITVYLGPGHTAANIGGLHAEAYGGNGTPLAIGRIGTPLSYYNQVLHLAKGGLVQLAHDRKARAESFASKGWPEPTSVGGYRNGGWLMPGQMAFNETHRPEPVLSSSQWDALERLVAVLEKGAGSKSYNLTMQVANRPVDVATQFRRMETLDGVLHG